MRGVDRVGRTPTQRCDDAVLASERWTEELKDRDPALYATVMELMWEEARKYLAMTNEQIRAWRMRGVKKLGRERRRAQRKVKGEVSSGVCVEEAAGSEVT